MNVQRDIDYNHDNSANKANDYDSLICFFEKVYKEELTKFQKFCIKYFNFKVERYITFIEINDNVILKVNNKTFKWKM